MKLLLRTLLLTLFTIALTSVNVFSQGATVVTDQPDYSPGSTVIITGSGFQPGETVTLQVHHYDANGDNDTSPAHQPWTVTADAYGKVNATWLVPTDEDELGATLLLTADGQSSGLHAEVTFTDAGRSFSSVTVGAQSDPFTYGSLSSASFLVTVNTSGSGNLNGITFSVSGLPSGTNFSFSPASVNASNGAPANQNPTTTLTISANTNSVPAGNYPITITASQTQGSNTTTMDGTGTFSIDKAPSITTVSISAGPFTYTGSAQTPATVTVTGAGGLSLTPDAVYSNNINAGTATASYSYAGDANHKASSDSKNFTINKADALVSVNGYTGTYDAQPHGATGTATGVGGVDLSSGLNLGTTFTDVPGGTASWTFDGGTNYNNQSGSAAIVINKADATVTVSGYTGTYDALAHGATGTATGVGGVDLSSGLNLGSIFTDVPGGTASWTFDGGTNYNDQSGTAAIVINKADQTITWNNPAAIVYGTLLDGTQLNATVAGVSGGSAVGALTYSPVAGTLLNAGASQTLHVDAAATENYNAASKEVTIDINKRLITITPDAGQFKYCGQSDPIFTYASSEPLISGNSFSLFLSRTGDANAGVGTYSYTLGTLSAGNNYTLTLGGSNTFEIKGALIDASASSVAIQLNTPTANLKATVTNSTGDPVDAASVTFTVTNSTGNVLATGTSNTNTSGIATLPANISSFPIGLYKVVAVAGSGCSSSTAYMTIYDPNGNFITGGGWILSPQGALINNPLATGKANFGFNAKYKKGSNQVDGNTEFQFQQGDFNFKSSSLDAGTLVISGAKATYRGVGTVKGTGDYGFMVSAVDGQINGGGGTDLFRIKIWDRSHGNTVVYDNNMSNDENGVPTTALGGGSIVIHNANGKQSRVMGSTAIGAAIDVNGNLLTSQTGSGKLSVHIMPNPTSYYFTVAMKSLSNENVNVIISDITGKMIEQKTNIAANTTIQLGNHYRPGIYIAQFLQGTDKVTVRLIKEGK